MFRYTAAEEAAIARAEANMDWFDENYPEWEEMSLDPEARRFIPENEVALAPTEDPDAVSDEDWAFFIEATFVDPAEREW